jgi:site-specific DNA-methyltransferase (adenine-specific)
VKPYYQQDGITIYHGDCRDVIDEYGICGEVLLTDPPYGIDGGKGGDARDFAKGDYERDGWRDDADYILTVVAIVVRQCLRVVKRGAVTPGIRNLGLYPTPADMGCLWTPASATHGPWGFTTFQPVLYYGKDYRAGKGAWPSGRQVTERAEKNGHPCPKPESAWTWLMLKVSEPGERIFDPFMGSGTTAVVAKRHGRQAHCVELNERYCEIAARRLEQGALFVAGDDTPAILPSSGGLFSESNTETDGQTL